MKEFLLITALIFGITVPVMAQTITSGNYISIPKDKVQLVQVKKWKNNPFFKGTDISINFVGVGLYTDDWNTWINTIFFPARGLPADKVILLMSPSTVSLYFKGLQAGSLKGNAGQNDILKFRVNYKDGGLFIDDLINQIASDFSGYEKSGGAFLFYDVVNYVRK